MALTTTLDFEEECTILSDDGANAFRNNIPPQVPASASGNVPLSGPLRIKPVCTRTSQTPVCIRWRRFGNDGVCTGSTARMQSTTGTLP